MKIDYEVTDTFGGEANYSWVERESEEIKGRRSDSKLAVARRLKKLMGITGQKCESLDLGNMIQITPVGPGAPCIIGFATYVYG